MPDRNMSNRRSPSAGASTSPVLSMNAPNASSEQKTIRKRKRVPLSCNFCRQRKLKCNRGHPCENCIKRGEEGGCVYLVGNNSTAAINQTLSQLGHGAFASGKRPSGAELRNRLDKLENLVLGLMNGPSDTSDSPQSERESQSNTEDSTPTSRTSEPRRKIDISGAALRADADAGSGRSESYGDACAAAAEEEQVVLELAPDVDAVRESLGMMKLDPKGKALYHGETHWVALLNEISEFKNLFERGREHYIANYGHHELPEPAACGGGPQGSCEDEVRAQSGFPYWVDQRLDRNAILDRLPPRDVCDTLVYRHFDVFDPIFHIIHKPSFQHEYESFWNNPPGTDIVWIGMLLGILTTALQSLPFDQVPSYYAGHEMDVWTEWQQAIEACLVEGHFMMKGSITIIRTLILLLLSDTRCSIERFAPTRTWISVGLLIRIAQSMGLHRDPKWFSIPQSEAEIRRNLWHQIVVLDGLLSISEGLPLTLRVGEHDVRTPANLNDSDLDMESGAVTAARQWESETDSTFLICISKISHAVCQIVSGTFLLRPRPSYDTILTHDAELRSIFAAFPEYLKISPENSHPSDPPYIVMQRMLLDMHYRKALIILHRPYAARVRVHSKFRRSKEECLDASLQMLRRQSWFYNATEAHEVCQMFIWYLDGMFTGHFFHASVMLAVELSSNFDEVSPFQREVMRAAIENSSDVRMRRGGFDYMRAKKQSLISGLLDRYMELEKMTPEERKRQASAERNPPHERPHVDGPTITVDIHQSTPDSQVVVRETLERGQYNETQSNSLTLIQTNEHDFNETLYQFRVGLRRQMADQQQRLQRLQTEAPAQPSGAAATAAPASAGPAPAAAPGMGGPLSTPTPTSTSSSDSWVHKLYSNVTPQLSSDAAGTPQTGPAAGEYDRSQAMLLGDMPSPVQDVYKLSGGTGLTPLLPIDSVQSPPNLQDWSTLMQTMEVNPLNPTIWAGMDMAQAPGWETDADFDFMYTDKEAAE
ncbi:fungal-specific transcription factor domain-containing protein [Dipodascopsis tothii]|uniref:fungal-specific transcription factor domain-containing protein n=1 Tax=Dipodascopsis tothii TaxID=44089 RepID=UPI0034CF5A5E